MLAPPIVTFTAPTAMNKLCAVGNTTNGCLADGSGTSAGWQGNITVHAAAGGVPITVGNLNLSISGGAFTAAALNSTGDATFTGVTVPEGPAVSIVAKTDTIAGRGIGMTTITLLVDTIPPAAAPTSVAAVVQDRRAPSFTLSWNAPAENAGGYDIHVKKPSTSPANPCGTEVKAVPFAGTPKAAGMAETISVTGLYIENAYCFTVAPKDTLGNIGAVGSVSGIAARFNQTLLQPASVAAGDGFGYWIDASADLIGTPGFSDILVGEYNGTKAYLFAGGATVSNTPAVTFSGSTLYFGGSIAAIGDIDKDGSEDVAVTSGGEGNGNIYIYKGSRLVQGATLTEAQADYVITPDGGYLGTYLGYPITRIGDFNGDGNADFAMGTHTYGGTRGRVVIVLGSPTFSSFALNDGAANASRRIIIDGVSANDGFGTSIASTGSFLIVGAASAGSSAGIIYSIKPRAPGTNGFITVSAAAGDLSYAATVANGQLGYTVNVLGGGGAGILASAPFLDSGMGHGTVDLRIGGGPTGPLGVTSKLVVDSLATMNDDSFGFAAFGGGFSGGSTSFSFVGTDLVTPDAVIVPYQENGSVGAVYILDGAGLAAAAPPINVATTANVRVPLPAGWFGSSGFSGPIRDLNGDGYGDIAVGELDVAGASIAGRVLVLW